MQQFDQPVWIEGLLFIILVCIDKSNVLFFPEKMQASVDFHEVLLKESDGISKSVYVISFGYIEFKWWKSFLNRFLRMNK